MNNTKIMIRNNVLHAICPRIKATRFIVAFYNIDPTIQFLRESKKGDTRNLYNNSYYEQISTSELLLEFNLKLSNIPYMNIGNIAHYLLNTL
jgi:hypothetical protein